jgi:uncharacterized UBP type Zn finger protein
MGKRKEMFGLQNFNGSCWVNGCLQSLFRIPEVQYRYSNNQADKSNQIDVALENIWISKGKIGLKDFFSVVQTSTMPAGQGIGDSHELFQYLCDKLPYLDELCRFKVADTIECVSCKSKEIKEDSVTQFNIVSEGNHIPISQCIMNTVIPNTISDWVCDKCTKKGCTRQHLIGSFPKVMMFYMVSSNGSIDYSSLLILNNKKYALSSVVCYNGSHWWTRARNMPPGSSWYTLDDQQVTDHGGKQFPVSNMMRILIYYRLED